MKKTFLFLLPAVILVSIALFSCKKNMQGIGGTKPPHEIQYKPEYPSISQFKQGISKVANLLQSYNVIAYLDTMPNGFPNINGRKTPLYQFASFILEKLNGNDDQVQSAVYDVFHFDGETFSLISYIRKAQMAGNISAQVMIDILAEIPLPPFAIANFIIPEVPVASTADSVDCCADCNPKIKILVTWVHKAPCGNYDKSTSGYAAGNKLTHMSGGKSFRFDAQVTGCDCPGTWSVKVTPPATATSYGISERGSTAEVFPVSGGVYTITFTYKVCGKEITQTFTLQVD